VNEITQLLQAFQRQESGAGEQLMSLIYYELRRLARAQMAHEKPGQTLQPTALVHEAWLRLVDTDGRTAFQNRAHFFSAAAQAMRCLLIDAARRRLAARHGGGLIRQDLEGVEIAAPDPDERVLAIHEALERFAVSEPEKAEVVKLRYFAGLTEREIAEALGSSERTVRRQWNFARAWLFAAVNKDRSSA
jgi:RNA polymerase sigma factor (TIGR02999 family)